MENKEIANGIVPKDKLFRAVMQNAAGIVPNAYSVTITPNQIRKVVLDWLESVGIDMSRIDVSCNLITQKQYSNKLIQQEIETTNLPFYVTMLCQFNKPNNGNGNMKGLNPIIRNIVENLSNPIDKNQFFASKSDELNDAVLSLQGANTNRKETVKWQAVGKENLGGVVLNSDAVMALLFRLDYFTEYPNYCFDVTNSQAIISNVRRARNDDRKLGNIPMKFTISMARPKGKPEQNLNRFSKFNR